MVSNRSRQTSAPRAKQTTLLPVVNRLLLVLIFFGIFSLVLMAFYPEWKKLSRMHQTLENDRSTFMKLQKETTRRERELYLILHDKDYLELIARDRLDLMKPNETIFRFSPPRGSVNEKQKTW